MPTREVPPEERKRLLEQLNRTHYADYLAQAFWHRGKPAPNARALVRSACLAGAVNEARAYPAGPVVRRGEPVENERLREEPVTRGRGVNERVSKTDLGRRVLAEYPGFVSVLLNKLAEKDQDELRGEAEKALQPLAIAIVQNADLIHSRLARTYRRVPPQELRQALVQAFNEGTRAQLSPQAEQIRKDFLTYLGSQSIPLIRADLFRIIESPRRQESRRMADAVERIGPAISDIRELLDARLPAPATPRKKTPAPRKKPKQASEPTTE